MARNHGVPVMNAGILLRPARHRLIDPLADKPRRLVERGPCRVPGGDALWDLTPGFLGKNFSILRSAARFSVSYPAGQYREPGMTFSPVDGVDGGRHGRRPAAYLFLESGGDWLLREPARGCSHPTAPHLTPVVPAVRPGTAPQRLMPWCTTLVVAGACRTKP